MELGIDLLLGTSKQKDMGKKMRSDFGNMLESRIYCLASAVPKNPPSLQGIFAVLALTLPPHSLTDQQTYLLSTCC